MYKIKHFWIVGIITGFFSGLVVFLLLLVLMHFSTNSVSVMYILIYLLPLFFMGFGSVRLRDKYGEEVLELGQGFRVSMLIGFVSAVVMSIMIYLIFTYLMLPSLGYRVGILESELISQNPEQSFSEIKQKKELIHQMLSPVSLAVYYFGINLVLLPFQAFLIAIFARRRNRDISD
jgi:hypothetical protein